MQQPFEVHVEDEKLYLFPDEWSLRGFEGSLGKKKIPQSLGIVAVALFRLEPDQDHFRIFVEDKKQFGMRELLIFGQVEYLTWVGGVALSQEREHILRGANRENDSFRKKHGWRPAVMITDRPNTEQQEAYIQYMNSDLEGEWNNFNEDPDN